DRADDPPSARQVQHTSPHATRPKASNQGPSRSTTPAMDLSGKRQYRRGWSTSRDTPSSGRCGINPAGARTPPATAGRGSESLSPCTWLPISPGSIPSAANASKESLTRSRGEGSWYTESPVDSPVFGREAPGFSHGDERPPPSVERNKRSLITGPFPVRSRSRMYAVLGSDASQVKHQANPSSRHSRRGAPARGTWRPQDAIETTQPARESRHRSQVSRA